MLILLLWALVFWTIAAYVLYVIWLSKDTAVLGALLFSLANALIAAGLLVMPLGLVTSDWSLVHSLTLLVSVVLPSFAIYKLLGSVFGQKTEEKLAAMQAELATVKQEEEQLAVKAETAAAHAHVVGLSSLLFGDIVNLINTFFFEGIFYVPDFVTEAASQMAHSDDIFVAAQGNHARQMLERLGKECVRQVNTLSTDYAMLPDYQSKIVQVCKDRQARLICADHNISRMAEMGGVQVIFTPQLRDALNHVYFVGQAITFRIAEPGQEANQGIGYLADGTRVVVDGGASRIGEQVQGKIQKVYQTVAGRMLHATIDV